MEKEINKNYNNFVLNQFENYIRQVLVESELPIGVIYLVLDKITKEIKDLYDQTVQQEFLLYKQNQEENNKEKQSQNEGEHIIQGDVIEIKPDNIVINDLKINDGQE